MTPQWDPPLPHSNVAQTSACVPGRKTEVDPWVWNSGPFTNPFQIQPFSLFSCQCGPTEKKNCLTSRKQGSPLPFFGNYIYYIYCYIYYIYILLYIFRVEMQWACNDHQLEYFYPRMNFMQGVFARGPTWCTLNMCGVSRSGRAYFSSISHPPTHLAQSRSTFDQSWSVSAPVRVGTWAQQHHPPKTVSPETIFDMEVHEHMVTSMFRLHRRKDPKVSVRVKYFDWVQVCSGWF